MLDRRQDSSASSGSESEAESTLSSGYQTRECAVPGYVATHPVFTATGLLDMLGEDAEISFPCEPDTFFKVMSAATTIYEATPPNIEKLAVAAFLTRLSRLNEWAHYDRRKPTTRARRRRDGTPTEQSSGPSPEPAVPHFSRFSRPSSSLTVIGSEETVAPRTVATKQHLDEAVASLQGDIAQGFARIEGKMAEMHATTRLGATAPQPLREEAQTLQNITRLLSKLELQANQLANNLDLSVRKAERRSAHQLPVSREELCVRLAEMSGELNDIKLLRTGKADKGVAPEIVVTAAKSRASSIEATPAGSKTDVPSTPPVAFNPAPTSQFTFGTVSPVARASSSSTSAEGKKDAKASVPTTASASLGAAMLARATTPSTEQTALGEAVMLFKKPSSTALRPTAKPFVVGAGDAASPATSPRPAWTCDICLLKNPDSAWKTCLVCESPRPSAVSSSAPGPLSTPATTATGATSLATSSGPLWECDTCALHNPDSAKEKCLVCEAPRPQVQTESSSSATATGSSVAPATTAPPRLVLTQTTPRLTFTFGSVTPLRSDPLTVPSVADGAAFSKYAGRPTALAASKGDSALSEADPKKDGAKTVLATKGTRSSFKTDTSKSVDDAQRQHGHHPYAPVPNLPSRHPSQVRRAIPPPSEEKTDKADKGKTKQDEGVNEVGSEVQTKPATLVLSIPVIEPIARPGTQQGSRSPSPLPSITEIDEHDEPQLIRASGSAAINLAEATLGAAPRSFLDTAATQTSNHPLFAQPPNPPSYRTFNPSGSYFRENSFSTNPSHRPSTTLSSNQRENSFSTNPSGNLPPFGATAPVPPPDLWAQTRPPVSIPSPSFSSPFPLSYPPPRPFGRSTNPFVNTPPPPPAYQPGHGLIGQPGGAGQPSGLAAQPGGFGFSGLAGQPASQAGRLTPAAPVFVPAAAGPLFRPPPPPTSNSNLNPGEWTCKRCTLINAPPSAAFCSLCEAPRDPGWEAPRTSGFQFSSHPWRPI
ncbi:Nuclear pore complex protein [Vanrija pseudolonga]|uniref:Nuclear pore complex protein n=1 Tax=Vanrija pseudolonga TaxID=143232 RepID=A0AAF1BN29_9TREE|nr:Nuclear pore complex protein [Vanrija pseudolonga]